MDDKIFLGKYRAAAAEMEAVGEIADSPLAYAAEEVDSGKKVVVGVVPAGSLKTGVRERLETEAMAARKLSHANIPALCDFGVEDDHLVYVTEDFEGTPAEAWVNAHGPMPVGPVLRIASQVLSALGAAAIHQINHRAINPGNVVLVPGQTAEGDWPLVKVLHFVGVAPKTSGTDVTVAAFDKSLHYASPEQIQNGTVDFRSELFSLGATMWFLLTGAPPLVASAGPTAGVAAEKIDAIPKKVRRLLAQMLAVNPEERPGDLLAFDRKLQDCLNQVERRESLGRKLGVPLFSPTGFPRRRRIPVKALALAALFLAIATVGAVVVAGYLRHGRIVRAEEPIGKPIGVPEASLAATPITTTTNAVASNTAPSTMAESNAPPNTEPPPANTPVPSTESVASASTVPIEATPAPATASDSLKDLQSPEPAPVVANNTTMPPVADSREVTSSKQPEPAPAESPGTEAGVVAQQTEANKTVMHEVRRAQPPDDEPASPGKGPENAESKIASSELESRVPEESPARKPEQAAKPKRQAEKKTSRPRISDSERVRPRSQAGSQRARLIGTTPEGWWMLESPSGRIIVVPPPRSSP